MIKAPHRVLVVGVLALALAGCTAGPSATSPAPTASSDPVMREADCTTLVAALNTSVQAILQTDPDQIKEDPAGALDLLEDSIDAIDVTIEDLTDQALVDAATDTSEVMHGYVTTLREALADPDHIDKTLIAAQSALVQDQLKVVSGLCS